MALLYSARFRRWMVGRPGFGWASAELSSSRGRHLPGLHFAEDFLPRYRVHTHMGRIERLHRNSRGLYLIVVAAHAVLVHQHTGRNSGLRSSGLSRSWLDRKSGNKQSGGGHACPKNLVRSAVALLQSIFHREMSLGKALRTRPKLQDCQPYSKGYCDGQIQAHWFFDACCCPIYPSLSTAVSVQRDIYGYMTV